MKEPVFAGACTAIITPFRNDGSVDYTAFSKQLELQITAGIDAICVCGTTGESATLSFREHSELTRFCVRETAGRCKIIAGTGSNNTQTALQLSLAAQDDGADAILLVTPYYNKTTQAGLIRHYTYLADRTSLPVILYNVPSRTGISFTAETYGELSKHPSINGVKEASGNFSLLVDTMALCGDDLNLWSGNDDQTVPMMALGAKGVISVASNLIPESMAAMAHLCLNGDFFSAAVLQKKYAKLIDVLFCEVNPIPIKAALREIGLDSGVLRLPLCEISGKNRELLREEMEKAGVPGIS